MLHVPYKVAAPALNDLTPRMAAVIKQPDAERVALTHAFGLPDRSLALARMAGLALPATQTVVDMASLLCRQNFKAGNDLIEPLGLDQETPAGLLQRVA